ncbi:MAG TPA: ribonuclease catalytic domain-containing protein [Thermodesulfobacteriota bacterium]|nr:ribonuclease catalytic domain-containing protein [Thermodesulfobacteriota bacterium]
MEPGKVVVFFEQKKVLLAVCLEVKGTKAHLLSEENREVTLGFNRIVHTSASKLNLVSPRETLLEQLKAAEARQRKLMESLAVRDLWDLVWEERREFSLPELAELVFHPPVPFDEEMALFRALFDDRLYFKQKGGSYEAREPEKVEEIARQIEREAEQERELRESSEWLARVWAGEAALPFAGKEKVIGLLKDYVLFGSESPDLTRAKALLEAAQITSSEAPFLLLVRLGVWAEDENLFLHRHQISQVFPERVIVEAERILTFSSKEIPPQPQDCDLTFLHPFTIDSEFTRDIDDALSLERVGDEYQVGVHITDVATFLNGSGEIFQEAMARAISIYLPDQRIPMIPPALSEGACSLIVGEKRRALSFLVRVDRGGKVLDSKIVPSIIQVERRLSYEQVDQLLEEMEEELSLLKQVSEHLGRRRMELGAFFLPRPERVIRVTRDREIIMYKRDRESPSQKMVAEFMILANMLAALFLRERGIPAVYRGQMEPRERIPPMEHFDVLQAYRLRRVMNRVEIGTRPLRHAGIGAEAYLTLTSPIRRFYDLLVEHQILGSLRGTPILSQEEVEEIITRVGPILSKVGLVEELTEQYWIKRYLEKKIGSTTTAVVLDRWPNRYLIYLEEYLLEVDMPAIPGREFIPGDQVLVRIEKSNARQGILKIVPV